MENSRGNANRPGRDEEADDHVQNAQGAAEQYWLESLKDTNRDTSLTPLKGVN